jgi:hypothetical protein
LLSPLKTHDDHDNNHSHRCNNHLEEFEDLRVDEDSEDFEEHAAHNVEKYEDLRLDEEFKVFANHNAKKFEDDLGQRMEGIDNDLG